MVTVERLRAEAQLQLSAHLGQDQGPRGETVTAQLVAAQMRLYEALRRAEYLLATGDSRDGESQEGLLKGIAERNEQLARENDFEELRAEAQRQARSGSPAPLPLPEDGTASLPERDLLLVKGSVPGPRGGLVVIRDAVKAGRA